LLLYLPYDFIYYFGKEILKKKSECATKSNNCKTQFLTQVINLDKIYEAKNLLPETQQRKR
jgi:hypothetical protein